MSNPRTNWVFLDLELVMVWRRWFPACSTSMAVLLYRMRPPNFITDNLISHRDKDLDLGVGEPLCSLAIADFCFFRDLMIPQSHRALFLGSRFDCVVDCSEIFVCQPLLPLCRFLVPLNVFIFIFLFSFNFEFFYKKSAKEHRFSGSYDSH